MFRKLTMFLVILSIVAGGLYAVDELSGLAREVKQSEPKAFAIIANAAKADWPGDYTMQVYQINKELSSFLNVMSQGQLDEVILAAAIINWSRVGGELSLSGAKRAQERGSKYSLLYANTDWVMVEYEYNRQVAAKRAFD